MRSSTLSELPAGDTCSPWKCRFVSVSDTWTVGADGAGGRRLMRWTLSVSPGRKRRVGPTSPPLYERNRTGAVPILLSAYRATNSTSTSRWFLALTMGPNPFPDGPPSCDGSETSGTVEDWLRKHPAHGSASAIPTPARKIRPRFRVIRKLLRRRREGHAPGRSDPDLQEPRPSWPRSAREASG